MRDYALPTLRDRVSLKNVSVSLPFGIGSLAWEAI